jgi:hypothetical protein
MAYTMEQGCSGICTSPFVLVIRGWKVGRWVELRCVCVQLHFCSRARKVWETFDVYWEPSRFLVDPLVATKSPLYHTEAASSCRHMALRRNCLEEHKCAAETRTWTFAAQILGSLAKPTD